MHDLFGYKHIILMIVSFTAIIVGFILTRKLSYSKMLKGMLIIGIISEIIKVFYYIIQNEDTLGGYLPKADLPFHLCSIQIIFLFVLFIAKSDKIKRIIMSFMIPSCLFGGIFAILIATYTSRNGLWILTLQYFGYHTAISVFALYLFRNLKLTIKDYINCLIFLGVIGMLSIYLNSVLYDGTNNVNFMYTVSPPEDNLPYLNKDDGWFVYILRYASLAVLLITLLYIKPIINNFRKPKVIIKEETDYVS